MKNIKHLFTALMMLCCTTAIAYDFEVDGIYYNITNEDNKTVEVTYNSDISNEYVGSVTIPSIVTYSGTTYSVTSIGGATFSNCIGLTNIEIPNSVTIIRECAFQACSGLTSITIPNSVTNIENGVFIGCSGLESIIVESGNTVYDSRDNCNAIIETATNKLVVGCKNTIIPNSVTSIGNNAFYGCTGLTSVAVPKSVTSIEWDAFAYCSGLTSITIPNSITSIENGAFIGCSGLESIIVESGNTVYDSRDNCNAIIEIATNTLVAGCKNTIIPNSVTSIGNDAFSGCLGLTSIVIPNSVTSIGNKAFYKCSGLTSIIIPNSITNIEWGAFLDCSGLKTVYNCSELQIVNGSYNHGYVAYYATYVINATIIDDFIFSNSYKLVEYIGNATDIVLPEKFNGENYAIGEEAFKDKTSITSITIPNSVTSIGSQAFDGCSGLTNITIPNSVTSIAGYTFYGCSGLASITIPNSITSIGNYAFYGCDGLTNIIVESGNSVYDSRDNCNAIIETATNKLVVGCKNTIIPNSVTSIGWGAFVGCSGLTSITIPNSVTSIRDDAFKGCSELTSIVIGNSVRNIGYNAFYGCDGLTNIIVESGNSVYDSRDNCNAIIETSTDTLVFGCKNSVIPNSVTSIGDRAFYNCSGLTSITIPNSVTSIGDYAFNGCSGLASIVIGNSVRNFGSNAFYGCDGLTNIIVESGNSVYDSRDNCNAIIETSTNTLVFGCKNSVIPNSVTSIGDRAFSSCYGLTSITIPNSVTSIGGSAFGGCSGLTSVEIPKSVTSIGGSAFSDCYELTSVTIPNSVTSIGRGAFQNTGYWNSQPEGLVYKDGWLLGYKDDYPTGDIIIAEGTKGIADYALWNCRMLTSVKISNSVTCIGSMAFYNCSGLTSVTIPNSVTSIGENAFNNCSGLTNITIPNSVTSIGDWAFYNCSGLTNIEIPNSVTSIGDRAFSYCSGLTSIEIPNSVTSIGENAFNGCSGLTSVTIGNSVTSIGGSAFYNCSRLTSIEIPNSVTSIGENAFNGCSGLTNITIPNSVTSIGSYAFQGCTELKTVYNFSELSITKGSEDNGYVARYADNVINGVMVDDFIFYILDGVYTLMEHRGDSTELVLPESCKGENYCIGASVFEGYTELKSLEIPNSVTGIGARAFYGCGIENLYISNSIESIGDYAFADCNDILEIKIGAKRAIEASENIFSTIVYNNACLYVPQGRKFAYEKTTPWSNFYILETDYVHTITYIVDGLVHEVFSVECGAAIPLPEQPVKEGYTFIGWLDLPAYMPDNDITVIASFEIETTLEIDEVAGESSKVKTVYDLQGRKVENPTNGLYIINGKKVFVK